MGNADEVVLPPPTPARCSHLVFASGRAWPSWRWRRDSATFYVAKLHTARFYFAKLLPETAGLIRSARAGLAPLMAMDEALF